MKVHQTNGTAWESLGVLVTSQGSCPAERAECKHFERHIHHHVTTARWLADADRTGPGRLPATGYPAASEFERSRYKRRFLSRKER